MLTRQQSFNIIYLLSNHLLDVRREGKLSVKLEIREKIFALKAIEDSHYNSHLALFSKLIKKYIYVYKTIRFISTDVIYCVSSDLMLYTSVPRPAMEITQPLSRG